MVGAILFGLMLLVIVWLVVKNAKQAKIAEKESLDYSKQLEKTMFSLENRNKDYAKMMKIMAHDLKNPIGGMVGIANLLLNEESRFTDEDKEMLQLIESSGSNSIEMINQLLNSGLAIENEILKKESIDLQQLLRQCTDLLQYKADEKKQKIVFISNGPIVIPISREKIWRVFNNLIVNAIKFSAVKTEILVVLDRKPNAVGVKIIDQGIGVPDNDKQKIFEISVICGK
ncbi:MAG: HAMP domain-containing histidine kinase, partial [Flavobacterium sp.]